MVPIGARFRCGGHTFQAVAKEVDGEYRMECEEVGETWIVPFCPKSKEKPSTLLTRSSQVRASVILRFSSDQGTANPHL